MTSGNNPAVTFVFRARDEATPTMQRLAGSTTRLGQEFRTAIPRLAQFGSSLTSLLITMGALDNEKGRVIIRTLAFSSALISALPALLSIIRIIGQLNTALKTTAVLQTFLLALSGIGIARIAIAAGAATAIGVGIAAEAGAFGGGSAGGRGSGGPGTTGGNGNVLQKVWRYEGLESRGGPKVGPTSGALNITIQSQAFAGSEMEAREFARKIGRVLQEEGRLRRGGNFLDA